MSLAGKKIMILTASGVEEAELTAAQREFIKTGATVHTIAGEPGLVNCWNKVGWGLYIPVDAPIGTTLAADYDMLVVPGGRRGVTKLAANPHAERIVSSFVAANKPMAFMGEGVELMALCNVAKGRKVAGPETSQGPMTTAGAEWVKSPVCVDGNVISGDSSDAVAFIGKIVQHFTGEQPMKAAA